MSDSITNNLDWYLKYAEEEIIPKKTFPYHQNLGITKEEYDFMIDKIDNAEYINTKDGKLFKKKDHEIQILSDENLNLIKIFELIQRRIQLKLLWENANMKVKSRRLMNKS